MGDSKNRYAPVPTLRTGHAHPHPEPVAREPYSAAELMPGYRVVVLDQRRLPKQERYEFASLVDEVASFVKNGAVRGGPALGITAAYGLVAAAAHAQGDATSFVDAMAAAERTLRAARPSSASIATMLERMKRVIVEAAPLAHGARTERLAREARTLHEAEVSALRALGALGVPFVPASATVLTHGTGGALAAGGFGTALGIVRAARDAGKKVRVLVCETRPMLHGASVTAWELAKEGIPVEVITDGSVAYLMSRGGIDLVVVGAERVARNGDVVAELGTYAQACIAAAHEVPFYVAAPFSTVDLACADGRSAPNEMRAERDLSHLSGGEGTEISLLPDGVRALASFLDVTPSALVTAIITDRGLVQPVGPGELGKLATH